MINIKDKLFEMRDEEYKEFHRKLIPDISPDRIIGIRTPQLRAFAKDLFKDEAAEKFISVLPHYYYEENNLHAFLVEQIRDFDKCAAEVNRFLPYVDNWATCDMMRPKCFKKHKSELENKTVDWIRSEETFTVLYGIGMLLTYFLDEDFKEDHLKTVSEIKSGEYYVNMMIAWYFATALAKQYGSSVKYIENKLLPPRVHNKAIQKAIESRRIPEDQKAYLRKMKT